MASETRVVYSGSTNEKKLASFQLKLHISTEFLTKSILCFRCNFMLGMVIRKGDLAFTDPTPDGRTLAASYGETPNFLVYKWVQINVH